MLPSFQTEGESVRTRRLDGVLRKLSNHLLEANNLYSWFDNIEHGGSDTRTIVFTGPSFVVDIYSPG
jgi:hypothetical protein